MGTDGAEIELGLDDGLLAREAEAAAERGDARRGDALLCARALSAELRRDTVEALACWRAAFSRDPSLLIAFWGLRRHLRAGAAWDELQSVCERRIAALSGSGEARTRADLWLERGRLLEDRLQRDDEAMQSYRAGLLEVPDHAGLLTALLVCGGRLNDAALAGEAAVGLLRPSMPSVLRASLSALVVRIGRTGRIFDDSQRSGGRTPDRSDRAPTQPMSAEEASRAFETLRTALAGVEPDDALPLWIELSGLTAVTGDPALRVEMLSELVARLPPSMDGAQTGVAIAILRERARLLDEVLREPEKATTVLREALLRAPEDGTVAFELADAIERAAGDDADRAVAELGALMTIAAPLDRVFTRAPQQELALRYLLALARAGRPGEALAVLNDHPELPLHRLDVQAFHVLLGAAAGDLPGLAGAFAGLAAAVEAIDAAAAAPVWVVAATLREEVAAGASNRSITDPTAPDARGIGETKGNGDVEVETLYRRALAADASHAPARAALERRLRTTGRWTQLAQLLRETLQLLDPLPASARSPDGTGSLKSPEPREARAADEARQAERCLEDLVAVSRDRLGDLTGARWAQDRLTDLAHVAPESTPSRAMISARAWVRRYDLELLALAAGEASPPAERSRMLWQLAERSGSERIAAAFLIDAARAALEGGDPERARGLLRRAAPDDSTHAAVSLLEQMHGGDHPSASAERAALIREELSGSLAPKDPVPGEGEGGRGADRAHALRFRWAWHAFGAGQVQEALDALAPLAAAGDRIARAWSWEMARSSESAAAMLSALEAMPSQGGGAAEGLSLGLDLGETLERLGDPRAAEEAFRQAGAASPSADAALGLFRVAARTGTPAVMQEALRGLASHADEATTPLLTRDLALLSIVHGTPGSGIDEPFDATASDAPAEMTNDVDPSQAVWRWAEGTRDRSAAKTAAGLLAVGRAAEGARDDLRDAPSALFARAAARARLGGSVLAGAVHDQVFTLTEGAAPIGVGLADLPIAGRPERRSARVARAERNGGLLAYALDIECALEAEAVGDTSAALEAFARALDRDPEGLEALDGIKRMARAIGDQEGAARMGMRMASVLRSPRRAAAELAIAGQLQEDVGNLAEAQRAYWHALSRDPDSQWLYERLRLLSSRTGDHAGLDRLFGHRLARITEPSHRLALLEERARHRLENLDDRKAAIEDFKRMLKIDPHHGGALRNLATLAMRMEYFPQAVRFLDRLLDKETDDDRAAALRLELADAHEGAREPGRAVEVLRQAASARPRDKATWHQLVDLQLRMGDWAGALASLRSWEAVLAEPTDKAEIALRIGCLLRDHARDPAGAAQAFIAAAELAPLGDGLPALVSLSGTTSSIGSSRLALRRASEMLRSDLERDPLDVLRLRRLREIFEWATDASASPRATSAIDQPSATEVPPLEGAEGATVAGQLLSLAGEDVALLPLARPQLRTPWTPTMWDRVRVPGAGGFAGEIWPTLSRAAGEMFPVPKAARTPARERILRGTEPRLEWIEAAAAALGLPTLVLWMAKRGVGDASDETVTPLEGDEPALALGRGVLTGNTSARFRVGRALALLRHHAVALERVDAATLAGLFESARLVAAASRSTPAASRSSRDDESARTLVKAMNRKERKALELEGARFGFETIDASQFRSAVLWTADRVGLLLAGDVAVALRIVMGRSPDPHEGDGSGVDSATLARDTRASQLVRFVLSDSYLSLRKQVEAGEG